jgi:hypothetical protein
MSARRERWLRSGAELSVPLLAALGLAAYLAYAFARTAPGFPWDDAWIHSTLARNLAETGRLGLSAGHWSAGSSSLLWVLLLAGGHRLGLDLWLAAVLLGGSGHVFGSWVFSRLAGDLLGKPGGLLAGGLYALFGPLAFLALSGMETSLFLALGIVAIWAWTRQRPVWAGVLLGLLLLIRIESLALWGLLLAAELLRSPRRRALLPVGWLVLLPLASLALGSGFRFFSEGHLLPLTMSGRRWLWGLPPPGTWAPDKMASFLADWRVYLLDWFLQAFRLEGWPALYWAYLGLLGVWCLGGLAFLAGRTWLARGESRRWGALLVLLWGIGLMLTYLLLLPMASFRHQVALLPALLLILAGGESFLFAGLQRILGRRAAWLPWCVRGLVVVALLGWAGLTFQQWLVNYQQQVDHINRIHVRMGRWIAENIPPDSVVATFDIGAIAYFGQHEIVDLGGLTDEAILPSLYAHQVAPYLRAHGATYLAMIGEPGNYWWKQLGLTPPTLGETLTLTLLQRYEVPPYARPPFDRPADYYFYPAYRVMAIYAIHWSTPAAGADSGCPAGWLSLHWGE